MPFLIIANEGITLESVLRRDREYYKSGTWKCARSPTGAHWWLGVGERFKCKHCLTRKTFPIYYGPVGEYKTSVNSLNGVFKD